MFGVEMVMQAVGEILQILEIYFILGCKNQRFLPILLLKLVESSLLRVLILGVCILLRV
jgi:hypothetical protein